MSAENKVEESKNETSADSRNYLVENVLLPSMFHKLAELGRRPSNEEEAMEYVKMAYQVSQLKQYNEVEANKKGNTAVKRASAKLDNALGFSCNDAISQVADDAWIKGAAEQFAANKDIQKAVLAYQSGILSGAN